MKAFKAGNPATRPHVDQRPSSSEKHARNDGYIPSRLRARHEKALAHIETDVENQPKEDITVLLTNMAFGDAKHYPNMLRANTEVSDIGKRSLSLQWKGHPEKQGFKVSQYDQLTNTFVVRAKFYLKADSTTTHQVSNINPRESL